VILFKSVDGESVIDCIELHVLPFVSVIDCIELHVLQFVMLTLLGQSTRLTSEGFVQ
jgi:hypothetical protein